MTDPEAARRKRRRALRTACAPALGLVLLTAALPAPRAPAAELRGELGQVRCKIVHEAFHENNWDLFVMDADGANPVNLTRTRHLDEMYPHVSPDGERVCFVVEEGKGASRTRSVCYMNIDGSGRTLVARNARQPCWGPDGTAIAYLKGEYEKYSHLDFATKGLFIYDLRTGKHREHPNKKIHHLYTLCWSPDGRWFLATVHAGMGYKHAILAIEADGTNVCNLQIPGCRPDISPDGKKVAWGASDWVLRVADLEFTGSAPRLTNPRDIVTCEKPIMVYHADWSPDGKYVAFSRGPFKKRLGGHPAIVGLRAEGWNICVADPTATNRWVAITRDGKDNKEPDWAPVKRKP